MILTVITYLGRKGTDCLLDTAGKQKRVGLLGLQRKVPEWQPPGGGQWIWGHRGQWSLSERTFARSPVNV